MAAAAAAWWFLGTASAVRAADPPHVQIVAPAEGASYTQGTTLAAQYACSDPVGVSGCAGDVGPGAALDTSTIGVHTFTVTATGRDGQRTSASVHYVVSRSRVYWTTDAQVWWANLDGTGEPHPLAAAAQNAAFRGVVIDTAAGQVLWADPGNQKIGYANLDGSGAGAIDLSKFSASHPYGLSIYPRQGSAPPLLYWADSSLLGGDGRIYSLRLGVQTASPVAVYQVTGANAVAVDQWFERFYYGTGTGTVSGGAVSPGAGGGAGDANPSYTSSNDIRGVALDSDQYSLTAHGPFGHVLWTDYVMGAGSIGYAPVGGGTAATLATPGAPIDQARGIAVDPVGGKVYWANGAGADPVAWAALDGGGGGALISTGSPANYLALLAPAAGTGGPAITNTSAGLACSTGQWASDVPASSLFRAPQTFSYAWTLNGTEIPGANAATLVPSEPGSYRCLVLATDAAGGAGQLSDPFAVNSAPVFTGQPAEQSTTDHGSAVFTAAVSGYPPPALRWQRSTGGPFADLPGATGQTLQLRNVTASMSGWSYRALATNSVAAVSSRIARLRVVPPTLTRFTQSRARWRSSTVFTFALNEAAGVQLAFRRRCRRCRVRTLTMSVAGRQGVNRVAFTGRIGRGARLVPGAYTVTATARDSAGRRSAPRSLRFTILSRRTAWDIFAP